MNNPEPSTFIKNHSNIDSEEFYFQWHITEKCNLRCTHCYQEDYNVRQEFSLAQLKKSADLIDLTLKKWHKRGRIAEKLGFQTETPGEVRQRNDNQLLNSYFHKCSC